MTHRILIAVSCFAFTTAAFAQTEETESVSMEMWMPGMPAPMNVNVRVKTKTRVTREVTEEQLAPAPLRADCGTGDDPGCTMQRGGHRPMDAETLRGLLEALGSNGNEINRFDIAKTTLQTEYLTAKQLGLVLDLFDNEIYRFDVAKLAAPHVVNPKHAMSLSTKFNNSIYATDFTKLMVSQR